MSQAEGWKWSLYPWKCWKWFLATGLIAILSFQASQAGSVDFLEGKAGFRMASLHWKYPNSEKIPAASFRVRYCELHTWGLHRCRFQVVEPNSSRQGRRSEKSGMSPGGSNDISVEIGGLRMATNYSFQVVPQDPLLKSGTPSQIALQTKGFSARATKCLADSSEVAVETGPFFAGRISVDESEIPGCFVTGDPHSPQTEYILRIRHHQCGSSVNGSRVSTVILVQENLPILTHSTRKFVVVCSFSPESFVVKTGVTLPRETSVAKSLDFSGIIRLSPQGTNLLIASKEETPRRGTQRNSSKPVSPKVVDESEFLARNNGNFLQGSIDSRPLTGEAVDHPSDSRRQSRAFFQPGDTTGVHSSSSSVPSAAAAIQHDPHSRWHHPVNYGGWEGFLVLGVVGIGLLASVSSLVWFVKSYRTDGSDRDESSPSENSSVTDDGPLSISSRGNEDGDPFRIPKNLDTGSELEVELDFEFSEERNTSMILRTNGRDLSSSAPGLGTRNKSRINSSHFHLQLVDKGWKTNPSASMA